MLALEPAQRIGNRTLCATTHDGEILRVEADGAISVFTQTDGRPLGIECKRRHAFCRRRLARLAGD
ncbi:MULTISPECIES: hypothetical protein [Sulfitobacter]|jgi:hypothetical protein|uniref:hypothetical protein n=1 Tax=Sulfitobacter TaxID=60136 RepID=UPI001EF0C943|nr:MULTISPECIES: hypothetical protein [unclassified Sulfitobacter]